MSSCKLFSTMWAAVVALSACGGGNDFQATSEVAPAKTSEVVSEVPPAKTSEVAPEVAQASTSEVAPVMTQPIPETLGASLDRTTDPNGQKAATTFLDTRSVVRNQHTATWAYFMDPTQARWYIAETASGKHDIFSLGAMESGRESWWRVGTSATSVQNGIQYAVTDGGLQTWSSTSAFWAISGGQWELKYSDLIVRDRELIQNTSAPIGWYFFQAPNSSWYIVNTRHWGGETQPQVHRFGSSANGTSYEWNQVSLEGAEPVLTQVSNGMSVRFKSRLIFPIALPANSTIASGDNQIFNTTGFHFLEQAGTTYSTCSTTGMRVSQHPGIDINRYGTTGNGDDGTEVLAIYDGVVVGVNRDVGSVVIRHTLADGSTVWSANRHMRGITVVEGSLVSRGATIGLISNSGGAEFAHLHFEIRSSAHPDPGNANYWCGYSAQTDQTLRTWLLDPMAFIRANQ